MNNPKAVGLALHALTPFATAFNPALGAVTSVGANIFSHMPKGTVKEKLEKISEQFARGELKPSSNVGGSSAAQAAVESRRNKSHKWIPFRGI